jgi:hypothetical protein
MEGRGCGGEMTNDECLKKSEIRNLNGDASACCQFDMPLWSTSLWSMGASNWQGFYQPVEDRLTAARQPYPPDR